MSALFLHVVPKKSARVAMSRTSPFLSCTFSIRASATPAAHVVMTSERLRPGSAKWPSVIARRTREPSTCARISAIFRSASTLTLIRCRQVSAGSRRQSFHPSGLFSRAEPKWW